MGGKEEGEVRWVGRRKGRCWCIHREKVVDHLPPTSRANSQPPSHFLTTDYYWCCDALLAHLPLC